MENMTKTIQQVLAENGMLVDLSFGSWNPEQRDDTVAREVADAAGARGDVGTFYKNLMANSDKELKSVIAAQGAARREFYMLTAHIQPRGPRYLPNTRFQHFIERMGGHRNAIEEQLHALRQVLPERMEAARADLGSLADNVRYPTVDEAIGRFYMDIKFMPVPSAGGFHNLPPNIMQALENKLLLDQQKQVNAALNDMASRVRDTVQKLIDRLGAEETPTGRRPALRSKRVEDLKEMAEMLRHMNITNHPVLAEAVEALEALAGYDRKDLAETPAVREAAKTEAQALLDRIDAAFN